MNKIIAGTILETGYINPINKTEEIINYFEVIDIQYDGEAEYPYQLKPKWENPKLAEGHLERVDFDKQTWNDLLERGISKNADTELPIILFWRIKK